MAVRFEDHMRYRPMNDFKCRTCGNPRTQMEVDFLDGICNNCSLIKRGIMKPNTFVPKRNW